MMRSATGFFAVALLSVTALSRAPLLAATEEVDDTARPLVVALPDDVDTRGDWLGTYGAYVYVLCGMRAPSSLCGGKGWPIDFSVVTGDPHETGRAWRSTAPAEDDRSVLLEPSGLRRTPGSYDDHGEARPLGKGPDLNIHVSVPEGPSLLSLYFFEIDWLQYRAYRIQVFSADQPDVPLATSQVSDFLKGKYSRFVVIGPADLLIVVERGESPNAIVSGVFLDRLEFPDLKMFNSIAGPSITNTAATSGDPKAAGMAAEDALGALLREPGDAGTQERYVRGELEYVRALRETASATPRDYYAALEELWGPADARMEKALGVLTAGPRRSEVGLLRYYADRARCDFAEARRCARAVATSVLDSSLAGTEPWMSGSFLLSECSADLLGEGRRAEASPFVEAYVALNLRKETPQRAKDNILRMVDMALKGGAPLPVAAALAEWERRNGELATRERLELGGLYYVGGENAKAYDVLKPVEPKITDPTQHQWCLVVMLTALLRTGRITDAEAILARLEKEYPNTPQLDEARFRLAVHYFDVRNLSEARKRFRSLSESTQSLVYQEMCRQYIERIDHLENLEEQGDQ